MVTRDDRQSEAELERQVLRAVGGLDWLLLLRNEVGLGFRGALLPALHIALKPWGREAVAAAVDATQRHRITYGLGTGSPDLVGTVRPPSGGPAIAIGLELKTAVGVVSPEQAAWHRAALARGVRVDVVRSVDDAWAAIERARRGEP